MNYEQGFKHAVPPEKNGYLYMTQLITRQISPAASVRVCVRVWKRGVGVGVGVGGEGGFPAPRTNQITKL